MSRSTPRCRSCKQQIRWVTMKSGKANPVDPDPDPARGNVLIVEGATEAAFYGADEGRGVTLGHAAAEAERPTRDLYLSHFVTCPTAREHRR